MLLLLVNCSKEGFDAETGTFIDSRDGNEYDWVRIRDQIWMADNLNFITDEGSSCYDNDDNNCEIYGRLYLWETALDVCPPDWHLSSKGEWDDHTYTT